MLIEHNVTANGLVFGLGSWWLILSLPVPSFCIPRLAAWLCGLWLVDFS